MKRIIAVITLMTLVVTMAVSFANEDTTKEITPLDQKVPVEKQLVSVSLNEEEIAYDVKPQYVNGILMVPLKATLEKLAYEVFWNAQSRTIEVIKGAQYTSLTIGQNSYIKNRMAPFELSTAPVIIDGRTLIPVEFFSEVLGLVFHFESNTLIFDKIESIASEEMLVTHYGFVKDIEYSETGVRYSISNTADDEIHLVVSTSSYFTLVQREVKIGNMVHIVTYPILFLSNPVQTSAIIVW